MKNVVKGKSRLFGALELLVAILLLGILAIAVIVAIDPEEQARRDRDKAYKADAQGLLDSLIFSQTQNNRLPWEGNLPWTEVSDPNVGVCGTSCSEDGQLINNKALSSSFKDKPFVKSSSHQDKLYIASVASPSAKIWACFVPASKNGRVDPIPLKSFDVGTMLPSGSDEPEKCNIRPDWSNTWCFECLSKKL